MKRLATAVMLIGLAMLIHALSSDIAVDGLGGRRIANVGLMHDRMVNTILGGVVILGGLLVRIFGGNLAGSEGGYVKAIDQLPAAEFWIRLITTILAAACVWLLVMMYLWPTTLAMTVVVGAIGWYTFQPQTTYGLIKKVWFAVLLLALILTAWHVIAMVTQWINFLTLGLFSQGVSLVESGNILVVFAILVLGPLALSAGAFVFAARKAKTA